MNREKIWIPILSALIVDIGLHFMWAPAPKYAVPVSGFVENGWFLPVVIALLLIMYIALALIFQFLQARLVLATCSSARICEVDGKLNKHYYFYPSFRHGL